MSKKVDLKEIVNKFNEQKIFLNDTILANVEFSSSKKNSQDSFANISANILQEFLSYLICVSLFYYLLNNVNDRLPPFVIKNLKKLLIDKTKLFSLEEPSINEMEYSKEIVEKAKLNLTKKEFEANKFIQFNSKSREHHRSFGSEEMSKIPNNFILKIEGFGAEVAKIRIGLVVIEQNNSKVIFKLKDIVDKRNGN